VNRRFQQTSLEMVADRRSARSTLVVRDRPKDDESYAGFLLRLTEINGYAATRWVRRDAGMPLDLRESTLITRIELDLPSLAESLTLDDRTQYSKTGRITFISFCGNIRTGKADSILVTASSIQCSQKNSGLSTSTCIQTWAEHNLISCATPSPNS
jgi:hypothetical protein